MRVQRMDRFIAMEATGAPDEFACKMKMSRSMLFETLQEMKFLGVDIRYCNLRRSYYYADSRRIIIMVANTLSEDQDTLYSAN